MPFDARYYLAAYPDVAAAGMDPLQHFLLHGLDESRDPHPLVDIAHLKSQLDGGRFDARRLAELIADPSIQPHPRFDTAHYLSQNPDVAEAGLSPLWHYIEHGAAEGRSPSPDFDADAYLRDHPEAGTDRYQAFVHFARIGLAPGSIRIDGALAPSAGHATAGAAGVLDAVDKFVARGWAYLPGAPAGGAVVEIVDGDRVVGRGRAGDFRRDLEGMGYGDAHCGFSIPLSRSIADGTRHVLQARLADGSLLHGAIDVDAPPADDLPFDPVPREEVVAAAARIAGAWDSATRRSFCDAMQDASLLLESGQHDAASRSLHRIVDEYPDNALAQLFLALAHLGVGRPDLALASAHNGLADPALAPWAWLAIGNGNRLIGHWAEAGDAFRQAEKLRPGLALATTRLEQVEERAVAIQARRMLAAGDREGALRLLVPALVKWPGSERLQELVLKARIVSPEESLPADSSSRKAAFSIALLGAVVDHLRTHGTAA